MEPTIDQNMPAPEYHAHPAIGSTTLKMVSDFDVSLQEIRYALDHDERKKVYDVGTLGHALILEGSLDDLVARIPFDSYRSKDAKQAREEAYQAGLIPVNDTEVETMLEPVERMRDAVMSHPIAGELLTHHEPEVSLFWETWGIPLKARLDAWIPEKNLIVDLKLVRSANPSDFRRQVSSLGYYIQARHYLNGSKEVTGSDHEWLFVAVGKEQPYSVSVHRLDEDALVQAQERIDYGLERWKRAVQNNDWPGYTEVYEQSLTGWETSRNTDFFENEEIII